MICQLCDRDLSTLTVHHLVPKQHTKRKSLTVSDTVQICSACHRQIHTLFDNRQLAQDLNTVDKLKANPDMAKFLAWVTKQDPERRVKVKR